MERAIHGSVGEVKSTILGEEKLKASGTEMATNGSLGADGKLKAICLHGRLSLSLV
jgi:hypothetical protein